MSAVRTTLAAIPLLLTLACTNRVPTPADDSGSGSSSTGKDASSSSEEDASRSDSSVGEDSSSDSGSEDGGFINPTSAEGGGEPGPLGSMCARAEDCISTFCYSIPQLGGVCSECLVDGDCSSGSCSIEFQRGYAVCSDGGLGRMCNSDDGCQDGLVCVELFDAGGIVNSRVCSECASDEACGENVCVPSYDFGTFSGYFSCVPPGSVETDRGCNVVNGEGDDSECLGGHCTPVALLNGLVTLGVCGDCELDEHCPEEGQRCDPASASLDGVLGGVCLGP